MTCKLPEVTKHDQANTSFVSEKKDAILNPIALIKINETITVRIPPYTVQTTVDTLTKLYPSL